MSDTVNLIELWRARLATISANANELSESEASRRIRAGLRDGRFSGETQIQAQRSIDLINGLSDDFLRLATAVDDAQAASKGGLFDSRERRKEVVESLLLGPSIRRPGTGVALAQRGLLNEATPFEQLTPEQLLQRMQAAFSDARDITARIDTAQSEASATWSGLKQDHEALRARATALGVHGDEPPFPDMRSASSDPLKALAGLDAVRRTLQAWAHKLLGMEQERQQVQALLDHAKSAMAELLALHENFEDQSDRASALLGTVHNTPLSVEHIDTLQSWMRTLQSSSDRGQWTAAGVGAQRLNQALREARSMLDQAIDRLATQLAVWGELEGRFKALRAKAKVVELDGWDQTRVHAIHEQVAQKLNHRPLDTQSIEQDLLQYADLLRSGRQDISEK